MSINYEELKRAMKESVRETVREEVRESFREQTPKPEKVESNEEKEEELANLKAELENSKKTIETLEKETESKEPEPSKPSVEETRAHKEGIPHFIGAWQQYCPTCGDKNPDFKDETTCDSCGVHLGAKEVAEKLKACPNCGGHNASMIKK